jgi:acetyl esterase
MPVDSQISGLLTLVALGTPMTEQTPEQARGSFRTLTVDSRKPEHVVPVGSVTEETVPGAAGDLAVRVYRPEGDDPCATIAFFHGGGFVIGDLETHDNLARTLCRRTSSVVVSVAYRLAPEHPFPFGADDAIAATRWIQAHLEEYGGDERLAVAGDSAGGNLSAVVTQAVPGLAAQLLIYPMTDADEDADYPSRVENATGYFLDVPTMRWFMERYAAADPSDVRLSPLRGKLAGLPPAVVVTAEFDPLRDEGEAYADALRAAGVHVEQRRYAGMIHGFMDMGPISTAAQQATDEAIDVFAELLRGV